MKWFVSLWLVLLPALAACAPVEDSGDFHVLYTRENTWEMVSVTITVNDTTATHNGNVTRAFPDDIVELKKRIDAVMELPEDISVTKCYDADTERLEILYWGRVKVIEGYCVRDESFRAVKRQLEGMARQVWHKS